MGNQQILLVKWTSHAPTRMSTEIKLRPRTSWLSIRKKKLFRPQSKQKLSHNRNFFPILQV